MKAEASDVTCVIPVFNGELHVAEAIGSVLDQSAGAPELVVVDDGSTDSTAAVVRGFGSRVNYVHQVNAGPTRARNLGLSLARTRFVAFLDADDLWCPDKLARQLEAFEREASLEFCVAWVENFAESPGDWTRAGRPTVVPGWSVITLLARRETFDRVGPFPPDLRHASDTEWFVRARDLGLVHTMIPEVLVRRRLRPDSRSQAHAARSHREYLELLKAHLDRKRSRAGEACEP